MELNQHLQKNAQVRMGALCSACYARRSPLGKVSWFLSCLFVVPFLSWAESCLFVVPFLCWSESCLLVVPFFVLSWMYFSLRRAVYLGDQSHLDYFLKEEKWEQWWCQNDLDECETCCIHPNCDQYLAEDNQHHKIDPHDCVCVDHHRQSVVYDVISWGVQMPCWMIM